MQTQNSSSNNNNEVNIFTYNINSIKNKTDIINNLLTTHNIDILFVTETKIKQIHESSLKFNEQYNVIFNSNKTSHWHGVAFLYKKALFDAEVLYDYLPIINKADDFNNFTKTNYLSEKNRNVITNSTNVTDDLINQIHLTEGRILVVKFTHKVTTNEFILVGTYCPNSGVNRTNLLARLGYRIFSWDHDLYNLLNKLNTSQEHCNILWLGDLNVDIDSNKKLNIAGTTIEERNNFKDFLNKSDKDGNVYWIDTFNLLNPDITERATYISKTLLLRLDYIICNQNVKNKLYKAIILSDFKGSDHVPTGLILKI